MILLLKLLMINIYQPNRDETESNPISKVFDTKWIGKGHENIAYANEWIDRNYLMEIIKLNEKSVDGQNLGTLLETKLV